VSSYSLTPLSFPLSRQEEKNKTRKTDQKTKQTKITDKLNKTKNNQKQQGIRPAGNEVWVREKIEL
jgi:hypothetical protein